MAEIQSRPASPTWARACRSEGSASCSDVAQRDGVVLGQNQIAERRGRNRHQEGPRRNPPELVNYLMQPDELELAMEDVERDPEQDDSDNRCQPVQPASGGSVPCHVREPV